MHCYLTSKQHYLLTQKKIEQQRDLQWVSQLIRDSIRSAGFTPCLSINHLMMQDRRSETSSLTAIQTKGVEGDNLIVRHMSNDFFLITRYLGANQVVIASKKGLTRDDVVMIADCFHGEIQELESVKRISSGLLVTLKKPLRFNYRSPSYMGVWLEEQFFMKADKKGVKRFFYKVGHAEQLTAFVNQFAVRLLQEKNEQIAAVTLGNQDSELINLMARVRTP